MEITIEVILSKYFNPLGLSFAKMFYSSFFKALKKMGYEQLFGYYSRNLQERTKLFNIIRRALLDEIKNKYGINLVDAKESEKYACFVRSVILTFEFPPNNSSFVELKKVEFNNLKLFVNIT